MLPSNNAHMNGYADIHMLTRHRHQNRYRDEHSSDFHLASYIATQIGKIHIIQYKFMNC